MITLDINYILATVYGKTGLPFPGSPSGFQANPVAEPFSENPAVVKKDRSLFDKPLYRDNVLGRPEFLPATLENIALPNSLVTITGQKTIVETPMVGADGSVKEIINIQDYRIKIICTEIYPDNTWPENILHTIYGLYRENKTLTLQCPLTDIFLQAKDNVVITSISLPDMMGIENAQVFELNMVSDTYFELEI
jgi:hypothetical protein